MLVCWEKTNDQADNHNGTVLQQPAGARNSPKFGTRTTASPPHFQPMFSPPRIIAGKNIYLLGVVQEKVRVVRVGVAEDDGRGRHGRRGLAGDVGAWVVPVHLVRLPRRRHVLRPLPAVVVRVAVADLA